MSVSPPCQYIAFVSRSINADSESRLVGIYGVDDDDDDDRLLLLFVFLDDLSDWMAADAAALYLTSEDDPADDDDDDPPLLMDDILSIAIEDANRFLFFNVKTKLVESESFSSSPPGVVVRSGKSSNINGEDNTVEDAASHR